MYCVKCRRKTDTTDVQNVVSKNGKSMRRGKCVVCGMIKTQFVKQQQTGGDLVSLLNAVTKRVKLPWAKFKGDTGNEFCRTGDQFR